jgi:hypothetical protein
MSKSLFTAAALSLLLATSGVALAHHKEGHSGGPSADKSEKPENDEGRTVCFLGDEALSPGQWAKAVAEDLESKRGVGNVARALGFKNPSELFKSELCSQSPDESGDVM